MDENSQGEYSNKGVIIAVALVMMLGTIGIYAMGQLLYAQMDDPYGDDRHYTVEGTYLGEEVTGTALCVCVSESDNYHTYQIYIALDGPDGADLAPVGVQFSASTDLPLDSIYESLGDSEVGGLPVTLWTMHDSKTGTDQVLAVSDYCTVVTLSLVSEDMSLLCTLVEDGEGTGRE